MYRRAFGRTWKDCEFPPSQARQTPSVAEQCLVLQEYLKSELGPETVRLMHTIKRTVDPDNLFNPGKIYEDIKPSQRE